MLIGFEHIVIVIHLVVFIVGDDTRFPRLANLLGHVISCFCLLIGSFGSLDLQVCFSNPFSFVIRNLLINQVVVRIVLALCKIIVFAAVVIIFILGFVIARFHVAFALRCLASSFLCFSKILRIQAGLLQQILKLFRLLLFLLAGLDNDTLCFQLSKSLLLCLEGLLPS